MYSEKRKFGNLGEDIVAAFLIKNNFSVLTRNYLTKGGELDIIAKKGSVLHFVEVKTVNIDPAFVLPASFDPKEFHVELYPSSADFLENLFPEENVHQKKITRMQRAISIYISQNYKDHPEWQIDVCAVLLSCFKKLAKIRITENVSYD